MTLCKQNSIIISEDDRTTIAVLLNSHYYDSLI